MKHAIEKLQVGDMVDLCGDPIADTGPHPIDKEKAGTATDYDAHRLAFEPELQTVRGVFWGTPKCARVEFDGFAVGFPAGHLLTPGGR